MWDLQALKASGGWGAGEGADSDVTMLGEVERWVAKCVGAVGVAT